MAPDYDELKVADLKGLLRERGLPVSGTKAVLIARLEEAELPQQTSMAPQQEAVEDELHAPASSVADEKVHVRCRVCRAVMAVPVGYKGRVECPSCKTQQPVGKDVSSDGAYPFNLTQNQWSLAVSIAGVALGLLAILVFFSAFSYEVMCPEESRGEVVEDGETYRTCSGGSWGPTLTRICVSCFLLVPMAASLTQAGLSLRKPRVVVQQAVHSGDEGTSTPSQAPVSHQQELADSPSAEFLQQVAKWFGVGLTAASVLVALAAVALVAIILYLIFTWTPY